MKYLLTIFLTLALWIGCAKAPNYSKEPKIEFRNLTKSVMKQGKSNEDTTFATIFFTDGDGDIGSENNTPNIFIIDKRLLNDTTESSAIPNVPPQGTGNGISGNITFKLYNSCCIFKNQIPCTPSIQKPVDTLIYQIFIKDRAGNRSNIVEASPIYLMCK